MVRFSSPLDSFALPVNLTPSCKTPLLLGQLLTLLPLPPAATQIELSRPLSRVGSTFSLWLPLYPTPLLRFSFFTATYLAQTHLGHLAFSRNRFLMHFPDIECLSPVPLPLSLLGESENSSNGQSGEKKKSPHLARELVRESKKRSKEMQSL